MQKLFTSTWIHFFVLLCILATAVWFSGSKYELRQRIQNITFDTFNKMHPRPKTDDILIIDIDEASLSEMGQFPWPRTTMAEMVRRLKKYGAKVVAFDMVFAESDRTSPALIANNLPVDEQYNLLRDELKTLPDNDALFSDAIREVGNVVTGFTGARIEEMRRMPYKRFSPTFLGCKKSDFAPEVKPNQKNFGIASNLPLFSRSAAGNGSFSASPDIDGVMRKVNMMAFYPLVSFKDFEPDIFPSLSLEALRVSVNPNARTIIRPNKDDSLFASEYLIKVGQYEIPIDKDFKFLVYFRQISDEEYLSAYKLFDDQYVEKLKNLIKDKIVFVGTSAEGLKDIRETPLEVFRPGVDVHVNAVEQILQEKYLHRPNFIVGLEAFIIGFAGIVIIILSPFIGVIWLGCLSVLMAVGFFYSALILYNTEGLLIDPVYPAASVLLIYVIASILRYVRSEADRKQIRTAFGHYISPTFMEELTKNPDKLKLGGEVRDLTVMFTDIRSFTKISEKLTPEELIQLMNDFLTPMSDLVMQSRGTIDKYMGDAMMAFWNAPLDDPDHARQACLTALAMDKALEPVNDMVAARAKEEGVEPLLLSAGIGINTGPCSVGNMGSKQRFAYSALGDAVNLASRLEGQTKTYGVSILIGEDTYADVKDLACLELDLIRVIGREKAVKVYTIIGDAEDAKKETFKKWQTAHNGMLAAYRAADFDCAAQDCKEARELADGQLQKFYDLYMDRITDLIKNPPPEDWGGIFVAQSK